MKVFIGLCFYMGITRKPNITDHWKQKFGLLRTLVNTIMSQDHFQLIWKYLHFYDSELPQLGQPDKLLKLRWFIEYLNKAFSQMYTTYGSVTIDESMLKFKGHLTFRQYLTSKYQRLSSPIPNIHWQRRSTGNEIVTLG